MNCPGCGMLIYDSDLMRCPRCGADLEKYRRNYQAAHIPARPETTIVGGPGAPLPGDGMKSSEKCPWCGGKLQMREGCEMCDCGYSACS